MPYREAWDIQRRAIESRVSAYRQQLSGSSPLPDLVMLLQHPKVYTLGRGGSMDNVKFDPSLPNNPELIKVDRGGEVTYHGPGQLVVYPILDLRKHRKDLHWYLRQIESVVIEALASVNVASKRIPNATGVWTADTHPAYKIAAVGTHASKWITMHGFALNVTTNLSDFERIIPCGLEDNPRVINVTSLQPTVTMEDMEDAVIKAFAKVFSMEMRLIEGRYDGINDAR